MKCDTIRASRVNLTAYIRVDDCFT